MDIPTTNKARMHADLVLVEQVKLLAESIRKTPLVVIGSATFLVIASWDAAKSSFFPLLWLVANVAWQGVRLAASRVYLRRQPTLERAKLWAYRFTTISFVSGSVFGIAGVLFHQLHDTPSQALLILLLLGMAAGSVTSTAAYWPANTVYVLPMVLPIAVMQGMQGSFTSIVEAILMTTFAGFVVFFGRFIGNVVAESFHIRFEKEELIQQLALAKDQAENANVTKTRFLAIAAHDLQQPMTAIAAYAELLKDDGLPAETIGHVHGITKSLRNAQELFDSLTDFNALERGDVEVIQDNVSLKSVLDPLEQAYAVRAEATGIGLNFNYPDVVVLTDAAALMRIVSNLVGNALAYTDRGHVAVDVKSMSDRVRIRVWDSGPGIPRDQRVAVFQAFARLPRDADKYRTGKGLGLYTVARLCELLDHPLRLRSRPSRGTVFSVTIPLAPRSNAKQVTTHLRQNSTTRLDGAFVLLIDDDDNLRSSLSQLLMRRGCQTIEASDQTSALERLDSEERFPDLIICDFRLGNGLKGTDVLGALLAHCEHFPEALIFTAEKNPDRIAEINASGFDWIGKAASPDELLDKIDQRIEAARTKQKGS